MPWSSVENDPVRPARGSWYNTAPSQPRPYAPGWYTVRRERNAYFAGEGTLAGAVKQIQRVGVTLSGEGQLATDTAQKYPVGAHFTSEDTSVTGSLITGLSAWWYTYSDHPANYSGGGNLSAYIGDANDGLTATMSGERYLFNDPQGSTGTFAAAIFQKYTINVGFSAAGMLAGTAFTDQDGLSGRLGIGLAGPETGVGTLAASIWQKYASSPALAGAGALSASSFQSMASSFALTEFFCKAG